ncbi:MULTISPECIES: hypothetical protein [Methylotenera]|uniref:hypothetical protein n=1 Tax=Methylotenera TaxID=359407 RepID=UPI00035CE7C6|nr:MULTISPECIES: hypothetical protein [Methylotenera]
MNNLDNNFDNSIDDFLQKPRGDKVFRIQFSRNTLIAVIISLLIHAFVAFFAMPKFEPEKAELPARELEVSLAPPTPEKKVAENPVETPSTPVEVVPEPKPKPKVITQKANKPVKKPAFKVPDVLATKEPAPEKVPPNLSIPKESTPTEAPPDEAPVDMMAYVNQQRSKRAAQESDAARQNAEATARELGPTAEQKRDENIKRNFQTGVNGIFEITEMNTLSRTAKFTFNGWTNNFSSARKEFFEVQAKSGQDVRLMMIKKMIALIRQHYQGDFNWESHRMNRTIVMSARPEDNAGLEEFMMLEFFGNNYKTAF